MDISDVLASLFSELNPSDWISLISAIAALIAVLFAARQVKIASDSHRHNQESQKDSLRPYMVAEMMYPRREKDPGRVVVKNVGKTSARKVKVIFDPPLPKLNIDEINMYKKWDGHISKQEFHKKIEKVFGKEIDIFSPGYRVECPYWIPGKDRNFSDEEIEKYSEIYGYRVDDEDVEISADGFSSKTEIVIEYEDNDGHEYIDRFRLNPNILEGITFIESNNTTSKTNYGRINDSNDNE